MLEFLEEIDQINKFIEASFYETPFQIERNSN